LRESYGPRLANICRSRSVTRHADFRGAHFPGSCREKSGFCVSSGTAGQSGRPRARAPFWQPFRDCLETEKSRIPRHGEPLIMCAPPAPPVSKGEFHSASVAQQRLVPDMTLLLIWGSTQVPIVYIVGRAMPSYDSAAATRAGARGLSRISN